MGCSVAVVVDGGGQVDDQRCSGGPSGAEWTDGDACTRPGRGRHRSGRSRNTDGMPELPDVEAHRWLLADRVAGRRVRTVRVPDPELLEGTTPQGLGRALKGRRFGAPVRHGKWLWAPVGGRLVVFHFRMTGALAFTPAEAGDGSTRPVRDTDRVVFAVDGGELRYRSVRRLGRVWLARSEGELAGITGPLGPDATQVDRAALEELLAGRRGGLKSALMDQELLAGLGNELVDDILWRARLHPRTPARSLAAGRLDDLHGALREVLDVSIRTGHVPGGHGWINGQRGRDEPACPRCGTTLASGTVAGRTSYWCPQEQPEP